MRRQSLQIAASHPLSGLWSQYLEHQVASGNPCACQVASDATHVDASPEISHHRRQYLKNLLRRQLHHEQTPVNPTAFSTSLWPPLLRLHHPFLCLSSSPTSLQPTTRPPPNQTRQPSLRLLAPFHRLTTPPSRLSHAQTSPLPAQTTRTQHQPSTQLSYRTTLTLCLSRSSQKISPQTTNNTRHNPCRLRLLRYPRLSPFSLDSLPSPHLISPDPCHRFHRCLTPPARPLCRPHVPNTRPLFLATSTKQ